VVAKYVFLRILDELCSDEIQLTRRVAYVSVLTGLLQSAGTHFCKVTVMEADVAAKIKQVVFSHLEISEQD
jgi:hypothetical protein